MRSFPLLLKSEVATLNTPSSFSSRPARAIILSLSRNMTFECTLAQQSKHGGRINSTAARRPLGEIIKFAPFPLGLSSFHGFGVQEVQRRFAADLFCGFHLGARLILNAFKGERVVGRSNGVNCAYVPWATSSVPWRSFTSQLLLCCRSNI